MIIHIWRLKKGATVGTPVEGDLENPGCQYLDLRLEILKKKNVFSVHKLQAFLIKADLFGHFCYKGRHF